MGKLSTSKNETYKVYICDVYITRTEKFDSIPLGSFEMKSSYLPSDMDFLKEIKETRLLNGLKDVRVVNATIWETIKFDALIGKNDDNMTFFITVNNKREKIS